MNPQQEHRFRHSAARRRLTGTSSILNRGIDVNNDCEGAVVPDATAASAAAPWGSSATSVSAASAAPKAVPEAAGRLQEAKAVPGDPEVRPTAPPRGRPRPSETLFQVDAIQAPISEAVTKPEPETCPKPQAEAFTKPQPEANQ